MAEVKKKMRPKTARGEKSRDVFLEEIGKPLLPPPNTPNKRRTKATISTVSGGQPFPEVDEMAKKRAAEEIMVYLNAITSEKVTEKKQPSPPVLEVNLLPKKGKESVVATVQTPRFNEKLTKAIKSKVIAEPLSGSLTRGKAEEKKSGRSAKKKTSTPPKSARKSESSQSVVLEELKLAIARSRNNTKTNPIDSTRKTNSMASAGIKSHPGETRLNVTKTETVLPARQISKPSKMSIQLIEITNELKALKNKDDTNKKPSSSRLPKTGRKGSTLKVSTSSNSIPSTPKRPSTAQPIGIGNQQKATVSTRSARSTHSEAKIKKAKESLSLQHLNKIKTPRANIKSKTSLKKIEKKKDEKLIEKSSKNKFLDTQNRSVDKQMMHLVLLQDILQKEILSLMDCLEAEHSKSLAGNEQCCCTPEVKAELQSLLKKQRHLITLQMDLRKRYGANLNSVDGSFDNTKPILDGFNAHFKMFTNFVKESDNKQVSFYCNSCNVSFQNDLGFRLHLESPEHVVRAYKEIHNAQPIFKCEECKKSLKGTTKYMNHVINEPHIQHMLEQPKTFSKSKISRRPGSTKLDKEEEDNGKNMDIAKSSGSATFVISTPELDEEVSKSISSESLAIVTTIKDDLLNLD